MSTRPGPAQPDMACQPGPRIDREMRTVEAMIRIYCAGHHNTPRRSLCDGCRELLDYAHARLKRCPFGEDKTTCVDCPVHCYKPAMRDAVRDVMRYAGPRMLFQHPILAARHLLDGRAVSRRLDDATDVPAGASQQAPAAGPSASARLAWVTGVLAAIYAPFAWIVLLPGPMDGYRYYWLRLWPFLPGIWAAVLPVVHRQPAKLEIAAMALVAGLFVAPACWLARRGGRIGAATVVVALLAASFTSWMSYHLFLM